MDVGDDGNRRGIAYRFEAVDGGTVGKRGANDVAAPVGECANLVERGSVSEVGVQVIDWTTTGAPPPICTDPTMTGRVSSRGSDVAYSKPPCYRMNRMMSLRRTKTKSARNKATPT